MDADAGLRILGTHEGRPCYAFVTRFGRTYTLMIYERHPSRGKAVGRRLVVREQLEIKELKALLRKIAPGRVVAFSY